MTLTDKIHKAINREHVRSELFVATLRSVDTGVRHDVWAALDVPAQKDVLTMIVTKLEEYDFNDFR
jgi:hypothetical protein